MNVSSIISAIGNNSSVTPILVKDGIEITSKVSLANQQGSKVSKKQGMYEAREMAIDEIGATAIWFTAPIIIKKAFNNITKNKLKLENTDVLNTDSKLLNGKHYQTLDKNIAHAGDKFAKSDVAKVGQKKLGNLMKGRTGLAVATTIGLFGALAMVKQKITEKNIDQAGAPEGLSFKGIMIKHMQNHAKKYPTFSSFIDIQKQNANPEAKKNNQPSFKGLASQAAIDGGIGAIRVGTSRDSDEAKEYAFKAATFVLFNYLCGPIIEKGFNAVGKALKMPIELDPKVLDDKKFTDSLVDASKSEKGKKSFLHFAKVDKNAKAFDQEKKIIDFIDEELKTAKVGKDGKFKAFNNPTLEVARKSGIIEIKQGKRAATKFIDTKAVHSVNEHLGSLVDAVSKKDGQKAMKGFMKKVKGAKYGAVLTNIALSAFIVGKVLPELQYAFREKVLGTVASPGVKASAKKYDHHDAKKAA